MREICRSEFTKTLLAIQAGNLGRSGAARRAFGLVYEELREIAAKLMRAERADHTLRPTALVHEAYCRLVDQSRVSWENRAHFFGIAARAMRQILVEHARARAAAKRGGGWERVTLYDHLGMVADSTLEVIDLDDALNRMAELDERMARVVELRVFGGLTGEETAHILGVTRRTVQRDWRMAKMWLAREFT
jgi:RNA polymerase sigma-70 factor, ECF subfamily